MKNQLLLLTYYPATQRDKRGNFPAQDQIRSMMMAGAMPPAAHMVTKP